MTPSATPETPAPEHDHVSTIEAARMLGLAVRSVQLMVDRGELQAWKTPGGHRRIARQSVTQWRDGDRTGGSGSAVLHPSGNAPAPAMSAHAPLSTAQAGAPHGARASGQDRVLLIEDSTHFQNLVRLLLTQSFPQVELKVASDAISGLALAGEFQPDVLLVDILLPGIDGATLITSLRSHPQFKAMQLVVITSLDARQLAPYAFALEGVPVIHKPRLVAELPKLLAQQLAARESGHAAAGH